MPNSKQRQARTSEEQSPRSSYNNPAAFIFPARNQGPFKIQLRHPKEGRRQRQLLYISRLLRAGIGTSANLQDFSRHARLARTVVDSAEVLLEFLGVI